METKVTAAREAKEAKATRMDDGAAASTSQSADEVKVEVTTTIKMGLKSALNLNNTQYERFQQVVEPLVQILSKMMRSASLALLYHLTESAGNGRAIPNLYRQKDTYWKKWLQFRPDTGIVPDPLEEVGVQHGNVDNGDNDPNKDDDEEENVDVDVDVDDDDNENEDAAAAIVGRGDGLLVAGKEVYLRIIVQPDGSVSTIFRRPEDQRQLYFSFGGDDNIDMTNVPGVVFDQALTYAAHMLKTAVINNAWVTLIPTLTRLSKATCKSMDRQSTTTSDNKVNATHIMSKIRGKDAPVYEPGSNWHPDLVAFIADVRSKLGLTGGTYLFDEYFKPSKKVTFGQAFLFRKWMLERFLVLKQRGIKLSPVFDVARAHVRLDRKILTHIALKTFETSNEIAEELKVCMTKLKQKNKDGKKLLINPSKMLPPRPKNPDSKLKDETLLAGWKKKDDALKAEWKAAVEARKLDTDYTDMESAYNRYIHLQTTIIASLFKNGGRRGWQFNGSIMTDGVSASITYSKMVVKKETSDLLDKMAKKGDVVAAKPDDKYDKNMSSLVCKKDQKPALHAGLDPGVVQIASISFHLNEKDRKAYPDALHSGAEHSWSLSGAEYRHASGIKKEDAWKNFRFSTLHQAWQEMGRTSSLKTLNISKVESYIKQYHEIEARWWELALSRRESRANLQRYIGKRKVLDSFFSKVDKELQNMFPGVTILLAYGSAVTTMKKNGKNTMAVPTTGAYKAAVRIFGDRCSIQDEYGSTKTAFDGETKEAVYRTTLKGGVNHVVGKTMPSVSQEDRSTVDALWDDILERNKKRRGASIVTASSTVDEVEKKKKKDYRQRYPEVRGLRYLPSKRIYVGRDYEAAQTIARLSAYRQLKGVGKVPAPFCRKRREEMLAVDSVGAEHRAAATLPRHRG